MSILITGGAGFIGSHTSVELLDNDEDIIIIDNFSNSNKEVLNRVKQITNKDFKFYEGDILDKELLRKIFKENKIEAVIHFASLKSVNESIKEPINYYNNNVNGTLSLLEIMQEFNVKNLIFSSSAVIYGDTEEYPIKETSKPGEAFCPYGRTKAMNEEILKDLYVSDNSWNIVILRYFNPIGAHETGLIGEDPKGIPNNLLPYISKVALGNLDYLSVFGNDYDTPDGTGIRDYIHVVDLAKGHLKALEKLKDKVGLNIYNLGTGRGYSVLEVIKAFEQANNLKIDYKFLPRREGDIAISYCDTSKAEQELGWKAEKSLEEMCKDIWNWQVKNPNGYL